MNQEVRKIDNNSWIKKILLIAGILELLTGLAHFMMPDFAYQSKGFSFLHQAEINFVTLCIFAVGILLIAFGALTILFSIKAEAAREMLFYYVIVKSLLWSARIILEILYPVKIPLFFITQPVIVVMPLLIFVWFLFVLSVILTIKDRGGKLSNSMMLLDDFLPEYDFNEVHSMASQAPPEKIFCALKELTPSELSPAFRFLFAIRSLPARLMGQDDKTFALSKPLLDQLYRNDFILLAETERELVFGLIGKFWELSGGASIHLANAREFLDFDQPDYAKAAANFSVSKKDGDDSFTITTETRIHIPDPTARKKFATYWRIIYPGSAWIRRMWLKAIKRRAERR